MYLQGSLFACQFVKTRVVGSPLGTVSYSTMGFYGDLYYKVCVSYCGTGFKSNQKVVGSPVTFVPLVTSCSYFATPAIIAILRLGKTSADSPLLP